MQVCLVDYGNCNSSVMSMVVVSKIMAKNSEVTNVKPSVPVRAIIVEKGMLRVSVVVRLLVRLGVVH